MVQPLNANQEFFFITTGVPFNLSFIDASNSVSISGSSTKGMLRKSVFDASATELIINHKTPSGTNFHLVVPIVNDARAKTSLSNYINSTKETALNLGSDIESSDIEYYASNSVFVVKTPVKVNMPKGIKLESNNIIAKPSGTPVSIKSTSLNDEVVCDYEGEDSDAVKTPDTKNDDWATALTLIFCVGVFIIAYSALGSLTGDIQTKAYAAVGLASLIAAIVMSVYAAKKKKATYSIGTAFCWAMLLMVVWLKFRPQ